MRIKVNPEAREELLAHLQRADCVAHADGDDAVIVEVPDADEEQARLEQVSRPPLLYPYWHQANTASDRLGRADLSLLGPYL